MSKYSASQVNHAWQTYLANRHVSTQKRQKGGNINPPPAASDSALLQNKMVMRYGDPGSITPEQYQIDKSLLGNMGFKDVGQFNTFLNRDYSDVQQPDPKKLSLFDKVFHPSKQADVPQKYDNGGKVKHKLKKKHKEEEETVVTDAQVGHRSNTSAARSSAGGGTQRRAGGGIIEGKEGIDTNHAAIRPGSFVIPKKKVPEAINDGILKPKTANKFQSGGVPVKLTAGEGLLSPEKAKGLFEMGIDLNQYAPDTEYPYSPETAGYNSGGGIHIKKSHRGRFTEYKKRTGKTTEEALHSSDPHVRKMAQFAKNAKKWKHDDGGKVGYQAGGNIPIDTTIPQGTDNIPAIGLYAQLKRKIGLNQPVIPDTGKLPVNKAQAIDNQPSLLDTSHAVNNIQPMGLFAQLKNKIGLNQPGNIGIPQVGGFGFQEGGSIKDVYNRAYLQDNKPTTNNTNKKPAETKQDNKDKGVDVQMAPPINNTKKPTLKKPNAKVPAKTKTPEKPLTKEEKLAKFPGMFDKEGNPVSFKQNDRIEGEGGDDFDFTGINKLLGYGINLGKFGGLGGRAISEITMPVTSALIGTKLLSDPNYSAKDALVDEGQAVVGRYGLGIAKKGLSKVAGVADKVAETVDKLGNKIKGFQSGGGVYMDNPDPQTNILSLFRMGSGQPDNTMGVAPIGGQPNYTPEQQIKIQTGVDSKLPTPGQIDTPIANAPTTTSAVVPKPQLSLLDQVAKDEKNYYQTAGLLNMGLLAGNLASQYEAAPRPTSYKPDIYERNIASEAEAANKDLDKEAATARYNARNMGVIRTPDITANLMDKRLSLGAQIDQEKETERKSVYDQRNQANLFNLQQFNEYQSKEADRLAEFRQEKGQVASQYTDKLQNLYKTSIEDKYRLMGAKNIANQGLDATYATDLSKNGIMPTGDVEKDKVMAQKLSKIAGNDQTYKDYQQYVSSKGGSINDADLDSFIKSKNIQ